MSKATRPILCAEATAGRFEVVVDPDVDPVDWDRAVARFLLAVKGRTSPVPAASCVEQPSAADCLWEPRQYSVPGSCIVQGT